MSRAKIVFKNILLVTYILSPVLVYLLSIIVVKYLIPLEFNAEDNILYYYNNHRVNISDLISMCVFLFATILTFDIHYYDQIEPKYLRGQNPEDIAKNTNKRTRTITICHILQITLTNLWAIVSYFTLIIDTIWATSEELIMALFFTDWVYLILLSLSRQLKKWFDNLKDEKHE